MSTRLGHEAPDVRSNATLAVPVRGVSADRAERRAARSGWASSSQVRSEQHGKAASGASGLRTQMEKLALPGSGSRWFSEWNRRLSWGSSLLAADRGVWGPASISQARGRSPYRNLSRISCRLFSREPSYDQGYEYSRSPLIHAICSKIPNGRPKPWLARTPSVSLYVRTFHLAKHLTASPRHIRVATIWVRD